jgi:hypothetical protein
MTNTILCYFLPQNIPFGDYYVILSAVGALILFFELVRIFFLEPKLNFHRNHDK